MQWLVDRYAMKALRVHGGGATSRRISVRVGGCEPMADRGLEGVEGAKRPLDGRESGTSKRVKSSKAEDGRVGGSWKGI